MSLTDAEKIELRDLAKAAARYPAQDPRRLRLHSLIDSLLTQAYPEADREAGDEHDGEGRP